MREKRTLTIGILCCFLLFSAVLVSNVKAVTVESKEELSEKVEKNETTSLLFVLNTVYRQGKKNVFKPLTEGKVLHSGAYYKIIFTPSVDCFVYIFQVDSAGKIFQLFPMESFGGVTVNNFNPVQKEQTYYLPAEGKSFQLDEQTGTERIYFLASRERDLELEKLYREVFEAQQQPKDELKTQSFEIDRLLEQAVDIQGALSPAESSRKISWKEDGQSFSVLQERLEKMCDGCVYVLSFEHR